jgi:hypothetical protein
MTLAAFIKRDAMFFNGKNKEKRAAEIVERAGLAATAVLTMPVEGETSVESWLVGHQGDIGGWHFFATVACAFLALENQGNRAADDDFRQLTGLVADRLQKWDENAPGAFYDLASFVVASEKREVGYVSASGLWVIWKVMNDTPTVADLTRGCHVGQFFGTALARD